RPYSTTFLHIEDGRQAAFGLGIRASYLDHDTWVEHRLSPHEPLGRTTRPPSQVVGWAYPSSKEDSDENMILWSTEGYSPYECVDLNRDGFPEVVASQSKDGYREYTLLDGVTGNKGWRRKLPSENTTFWNALKRDANNDAIDDLVVLISERSDKRQPARVELVSGSTGKTLWKHSDAELGNATILGCLERIAGQVSLFLYQNEQTKTVTCLDLDSRTIAWSSHSFLGTLDSQAFATWNCDGKIVWFSTCQTMNEGHANFVNAETGESLLQIPIGQKPYAPWTNWIRWEGRELLPIQTTTLLESNDAKLVKECRVDLWLVDRSLKVVGSWSETTDAASSKVVSSWFEKSHYDLPFPTVVKTSDGRELLALTTCFDRSIGVRLLGWDGSDTKKVVTDRSVVLPIDPRSADGFVKILDCNGDGVSDFVSMSDDGIHCTSGTGDLLWHQPAIPTAGNLGSFEHNGRSYLSLQTQPYDHNSMHWLDASTGEASDSIQDQPNFNALNSKELDHASFITCNYTPRGCILTAIRKQGVRDPHTVQRENDPREARLLPWVVIAKSVLAQNPVTLQRLSWPRILKLALCVYFLPVLVAWSCFRRRFSLRHLLLVATTTAVALSVALADRNAYPTTVSNGSYITALAVAFEISLNISLLALPLMELTKTRWRRRLSVGLYGAMLLIVPTLTLLSNPVGAIGTTYVPDEFWHLFWFALVPTGMLLFLLHSLRMFSIGALRLASGLRSITKPRSAPHALALQETGGSNGR
ncbi:MAG: hypothetical protein IT423_16725, partial [Pirellulaceae bacterium]|nr:hypothetical protein [Pirellulaceae bacterium]